MPTTKEILDSLPPAIYDKFETEGLTLFTEHFTMPNGGAKMVRQGFVLPKQLPNGTMIYERTVTRTITPEMLAKEESDAS